MYVKHLYFNLVKSFTEALEFPKRPLTDLCWPRNMFVELKLLLWKTCLVSGNNGLVRLDNAQSRSIYCAG